jgi:hypothetical protein
MSLRLESWVNGKLPSDPPRLAKVLGFSAEQVERALPEVAARDVAIAAFLGRFMERHPSLREDPLFKDWA